MKTHHSLLATFFLLAFLQILPVQAQRSSGSRGVDHANLPHGYNIMWDFVDGVLRIWAKEDYKNPLEYVHWSWKDCTLPYKAYIHDPDEYEDYLAYERDLQTEGDDHWEGLNGISPAYPVFTETPWYALREHVRQIQIDGSIYYLGSFSLTYFTNCRSVILHEGVEEMGTGAITHLRKLEHMYFPSTLDYIGPLCFIKSPDGKPLELICNIPEPIELDKVYWEVFYLFTYNWRRSWCFNSINAKKSFLHVPSEEAIGLYTDYEEITWNTPIVYINSWKGRFNNIFHRTQPVVEGVDIVGGDIILAPTLNPKQQLSVNLFPANAMTSSGRAGETGSGVTWNIGNYQSTGTEDNIAKVTGDGGLLTFKNLGKTRVYVTTNSLGYYTYET